MTRTNKKPEAINLPRTPEEIGALRDLGERIVRLSEALSRSLAVVDAPDENEAQAANGTHYAVVPTEELLESGAIVKPKRVCATLADAVKVAKRETKKVRKARGTGGYRVIETEAKTARDFRVLADDLVEIPSVQIGGSHD